MTYKLARKTIDMIRRLPSSRFLSFKVMRSVAGGV